MQEAKVLSVKPLPLPEIQPLQAHPLRPIPPTAKFQIVMIQIIVIGLLKFLIILLEFVQILVNVLLLIDLDQNAGNVGTVIGNPLDVGQQILIDVTQLYGAGIVLQTLDVTVLQLHIQRIYHFFQRFYLMCNGKVIIFKCLKRQIQGLQQCVGDNVQFSGSISGEMNALLCSSQEDSMMLNA